MNLLHMKYAVEIAETSSINKAAEKLYVGQSALSRAIKELESSLGVTLFDRSARGMTLTPDGEVFIRYARTILKQVDAVEELFSRGDVSRKRFSLSVPRASYIAEAFAQFSRKITEDAEAEVFYRETNSIQTIKNVQKEDYRLGIIRFSEDNDRYYRSLMEEKELTGVLITEFRYVLLMRADSPLAALETITYDDLHRCMEIAHADPSVPSLPIEDGKKEDACETPGRRIYVFERASQFSLLSENPDTFMWVSPVPKSLLDRYGLVERECASDRGVYKDVFIHRKDYTLTPLDNAFIEHLIRVKRETIH